MSDLKETATGVKYIKGEQIKSLVELEGLELAVANYNVPDEGNSGTDGRPCKFRLCFPSG
jgi:hypothetical protein